MASHARRDGIDPAVARARFDARRAAAGARRGGGSAAVTPSAPWAAALRADGPTGGAARAPAPTLDYDEDELVEDQALLRRRGGRARSAGRRGLRAPVPPRKDAMRFDSSSQLPSTFDAWRSRGRQEASPLSSALDSALGRSLAATSPSRAAAPHYAFEGDGEDDDAVAGEIARRRKVADRAREYYGAASRYPVSRASRATSAPRSRAAALAFSGAPGGTPRTTASNVKVAQERFKLKMWRMLKAVELANAHREAMASEVRTLSDDLAALRGNTAEVTTKRFKAEAALTQLTQDRELTLSNIYSRRRDLDAALASTRTWADKAATVLKSLKEVKARRSARHAEARARISMRGLELDKREKRLRSTLRKLEVAVDDIRVEVARKHEALAVHEALIAEARSMHRSLALHDEGRLTAADVGAKRAARAKEAGFKQRIALLQGDIVEAKQAQFALADGMLEDTRRLESGRVVEKASMAQLAMLRLQDSTERTAVEASRAMLRANAPPALTQG